MEGVPVADTFHLPPEFHEGSTSHVPTPLIRFCLTINCSLPCVAQGFGYVAGQVETRLSGTGV